MTCFTGIDLLHDKTDSERTARKLRLWTHQNRNKTPCVRRPVVVPFPGDQHTASGLHRSGENERLAATEEGVSELRCKSMCYTTGFARRQQGRICHAEPNGGQGVLTTLPIVIEEDTLVLNAAVPCSGSLQVEILDDQGQPISGFEKANCHPIEGDSIEHEVHWKNGQLKALQGTPVLLRFLLGNAKLYSYQMW
jgi:hypothetical protein